MKVPINAFVRGKFALPGYSDRSDFFKFFSAIFFFFYTVAKRIYFEENRRPHSAFRSTGFAINLFRVYRKNSFFFFFFSLFLSLSVGSSVQEPRSRVTLNFLARPPKTARFIVLGLEYDSLALFWHNSTDARFFFLFFFVP